MALIVYVALVFVSCQEPINLCSQIRQRCFAAERADQAAARSMCIRTPIRCVWPAGGFHQQILPQLDGIGQAGADEGARFPARCLANLHNLLVRRISPCVRFESKGCWVGRTTARWFWRPSRLRRTIADPPSPTFGEPRTAPARAEVWFATRATPSLLDHPQAVSTELDLEKPRFFLALGGFCRFPLFTGNHRQLPEESIGILTIGLCPKVPVRFTESCALKCPCPVPQSARG